MAAGVSPSSTVARQTPVRKHVTSGSNAFSRNLHPTSTDRFLFFSTATSSRVRAADPPPPSSCTFVHPRGLILPVTIDGAGDSRQGFFLLKRLKSHRGWNARSGRVDLAGKQQFIIRC